MTWDFHIMRFGGLLAWELPEACNFSSLYSLAHSILSGSGLRVRWILKFVFSLVNWIFIHVTYICLSSASLYLSHMVEHCFSSVFYVDKMKQSQSVFCFIIWVMDYAHRQAEEPVAKSERGPCLPLFCAQYIKFFKHGLQHWGLQRLIWSWFGIHFFWVHNFFLSLSKIHSKNTSPMGVISSVPRMASDIFLHPPCSADRLFGVKNTQSLCITFLNFFASLLYAFPDLMTALSKPGALIPWPPDVEILLRACPRTSLKWQCVYKTITCLESSAFVFHFSNWGLQLGCCQCTFWISQKLGRWVLTF